MSEAELEMFVTMFLDKHIPESNDTENRKEDK